MLLIKLCTVRNRNVHDLPFLLHSANYFIGCISMKSVIIGLSRLFINVNYMHCFPAMLWESGH
jgi:hypothetical protein